MWSLTFFFLLFIVNLASSIRPLEHTATRCGEGHCLEALKSRLHKLRKWTGLSLAIHNGYMLSLGSELVCLSACTEAGACFHLHREICWATTGNNEPKWLNKPLAWSSRLCTFFVPSTNSRFPGRSLSHETLFLTWRCQELSPGSLACNTLSYQAYGLPSLKANYQSAQAYVYTRTWAFTLILLSTMQNKPNTLVLIGKQVRKIKTPPICKLQK